MKTLALASSLLLALLFHPGWNSSPAVSQSASTAAFYVSPDGNDSWTGRLEQANAAHSDGPFKSVTRARDAVRQSKGGASGPLTVYLRRGTYELNEPLVFAPQDSGTPESPIVYASYPGETAVISGGRKIINWRQAQGGLWSAPVPGVKDGKWYFHELFVNGERRIRARSPNPGSFFHVEGQVAREDVARFNYHGDDVRQEWAQDGDVEVVGLNKWQVYRMPVRSVDPGSHTVTLSTHVWPNYDEENSRYWIENSFDLLDVPGEWYLNRREGVVYYKPGSGEDMNRAEIVAPAMEQVVRFSGDGSAGQYVHDITLRGLTIAYGDWSISSDGYAGKQASSEIGAAVDVQGARNVTIEKCLVVHMGLYGIAFGKGSKKNHIVNNELTDLGGGGIKIGDPDSGVHPARGGGPGGDAGGAQGGGQQRRRPGFDGQQQGPFGGRRRPPFGGQQGGQPGGGQGGRGRAQSPPGEPQYPEDPADYRAETNYPNGDNATSSENVISDNNIHDLGIIFPAAVGVWVGQSYGNTVSHNEIHDTYYSGISCGWTWGFGPTAAHDNTLEFNRIYSIGRQLMNDMGGIYVLGRQPGTVVRNNLIHDVHHAEGQGGYGGWGIYLDSASSEITVEKNIVYENDESIVNNQGEQNTITNNIFAFGKNTQFQRNRAAYRPSFNYQHNIVYYRDGVLMRIRPDQGQFTMDSNDYYRKDGDVEIAIQRSGSASFKDWQGMGQDPHSITADPHFVDPEHGNFSLKSDSPATKIGFVPIDMSQVGPRK